jgi:phytoene desaturase
MPDFFEELFIYCGKDIKNYLNLKILDINYKIFYPDGQCLTVYRDSDRTREELEKIESVSPISYDKFIKETERIYSLVKPLLYKHFTPLAITNLSYLPLLRGIRPFETYWGLAKKFFKSEKLRYAFTFEAMFMGVSPFQAPAFYSIISYTDHVQKIAHPMGGMYQIPLALEKMAREFGAKFHYESEISEICNNGSVEIKTGDKKLNFDTAVINADYAYAKETLLKKEIPDYKYSCSVYLIYLGLKKKVPLVAHHNLFFASDLRVNLDDIFNNGKVSDDPSFYVHVPTVTDESLAPLGKEIFYILVPVPNLLKSRENFMEIEEQLREKVFSKINQRLGINLEELIEVEHRFFPEDFIRYYNIKFGATFGLAHNLMQSAFFRPANFDKKLRNIYFVGASTQPGGGLPVVIASSRIVADLMDKS